MKRILLMIFRNLLLVPGCWIKLNYYAMHTEKYTDVQKYSLLRWICERANKGGNIHIEAHGAERIPEEGSFLMCPNHQGLYDVIAIMSVCPRPFCSVAKKELKDIQFLKQVFALLDAYIIDREDLRQSMHVIMDVTEDMKNGRPFLIFPEGTRSKQGNKLLDFKGGTFKTAVKSQSPIIPVALIDSYKAFDTGSAKPLTVQVHILEPMQYEEYKDMKTTEIAAEVKSRIEAKIAEVESL